MAIVYKYRLRCDTEDTHVFSYGTTIPTKCPNDTKHKINSTKTTIVETISPETNNITQIVPGYYKSSSVKVAVPITKPGELYQKEERFDMDINLWLIEVTTTDDMIGDVFSIIQSPETLIGAVTVRVSADDTVLNVSPTAVMPEVIVRGLELLITDGVTKTSLGIIIDVDSENNQLTVKKAPGIDYAPGSYLMVNAYMVEDLYIDSARTFVFGSKGIATKLLPAQTPFLFNYTNNNGSAKTLYFRMEYNYT